MPRQPCEHSTSLTTGDLRQALIAIISRPASASKCDLAAPGASWGLQAGSNLASSGRDPSPRIFLVAPEDERGGPGNFCVEIRAVVEQSGLPRRELLRALGAAIVARMA